MIANSACLVVGVGNLIDVFAFLDPDPPKGPA
jgi:hypothetical protein